MPSFSNLQNIATNGERFVAAQKKYADAESRISSICSIFIMIILALTFFASPIAEEFFSYEVTEYVTKKEAYQHPVGTVDTYVCYTTRYGKCYHARSCGSLWNSSYKTTVYEAKEDGYRACSKCTPSEKITLTLTETKYRDVTETVTVTKEPALQVWFCGTGILIVVYFVLTFKHRQERKAAYKEMQRIREMEKE